MGAEAKDSIFDPAASLHREFGELLVSGFDDPKSYGVHQMFDDFWQYAPESVIQQYLADFSTVAEQRDFLSSKHSFDILEMQILAESPAGSLGQSYHHHMVSNGLDTEIVKQVKGMHLASIEAGKCTALPDELHLSVMRFFETHDMLHALTGYAATEEGEVGLVGFYMAQFRFPYFAMWIAVLTGRMAFLTPSTIRPIMDTLAQGWKLGQASQNLQFVPWEERMDESLDALRCNYNIDEAVLRYGDEQMMTNKTAGMNREFAELFFQVLDNPSKTSVYQLLGEWWKTADAAAIEAYVADLTSTEEGRSLTEHLGHKSNKKINTEALAQCATGSLGQAYWNFLKDNNLSFQEIEGLIDDIESENGSLRDAPQVVRQSMARMVEVHYLIQCLLGYGNTEIDKVRMIGFLLAQTGMPYLAMWVAVIAARLAFQMPGRITQVLDALFCGWASGRHSDNMLLVSWEECLNEPVAYLRDKFEIVS